MTFDNFRTQWTGKPVDFDGIYPNQCMDLMHQYAYDVLGITDKAVLAKPWAALVYTQFSWTNLFDKIANSPTGVPVKGDIILWKEALNYDASVQHGYGHVAIFIDGDANGFNSFDANWPLGSLPHVQHHDYNNVAGWLHPKTQPQPIDDHARLVTKATNWDTTANFMHINPEDANKGQEVVNTITQLRTDVQNRENSIHEKDAELVQKDQLLTNLNQQINDRNNDIAKLNASTSTLEHQATELQTRVDSLTEQATKVPGLLEQIGQLEHDRSLWLPKEQKYLTQITNLRAQVDAVKSPIKKLLLQILDSLKK